ncbi:MAG: PP2C family protein-serine/threonine phosphatase [Anaerolineales bacterium]
MIITDSSHLTVAALSHPGEAREINEDRYSVTYYTRESDQIPVTLAMVADGIGGHQAGEVAAQIAVDQISSAIAEASGEDPVAELSEAVVAAGQSISQSSMEDEARQGMGSTIATAMVAERRLYAVSVGDSRTYLVRSGTIQQISIDHTWVQEAINHGILTPEEARNHPNAHVLHRHLGGDRDPIPDARLRLSTDESDEASEANQGLRLTTHDQILLCSDGLTDLVEDREILEVLSEHAPEEAASALIDLARARGGHDNITLVIVEVPDADTGRSRGCLRSGLLLAAGGLALLLLVAFGLGLSLYLGFWPW